MTKEEAIELYETNWWESKSAYEIVKFQLYEPLLCMPIDQFDKAVQEVLGMSIWSFEFNSNFETIKKEFKEL